MLIRADRSAASLAGVAARHLWRAENGGHGGGSLSEGRRGRDLTITVPPGTVVIDEESGEVIADLAEEGAVVTVARGGAGGRGNRRFATPTNRAPRMAEPGLAGETRSLRLELKLVADAGLVGKPNAGKSSLLAAITAARPKIADYPFTTLDPQLGVAYDATGRPWVVADIPGLIQGAAEGAGLGLLFLRHIERTRVLVYVIDGASSACWEDLETVRAEVAAYSAELGARPSVVVINKADLLGPAERQRRLEEAPPGSLLVSAATGEGTEALVARIAELAARVPAAAAPAPPPPTVKLRAAATRRQVEVTRHNWGFEVSGGSIARLLDRTDFDNPEALARFQVAIDRMGVTAALIDAGVEPGDLVRVGDREFEFQP